MKEFVVYYFVERHYSASESRSWILHRHAESIRRGEEERERGS